MLILRIGGFNGHSGILIYERSHVKLNQCLLLYLLVVLTLVPYVSRRQSGSYRQLELYRLHPPVLKQGHPRVTHWDK